MDDDFGDLSFGDAADCGGFSKAMYVSEGEDSDDDYLTPKPNPANVVRQHLRSMPNQTYDVASTSASSASSSGCAVLHPPLDLAKMFAEASFDDEGTILQEGMLCNYSTLALLDGCCTRR